MTRPARVLMVCTGNICRSTMAHAVLEQAAARAGVDVVVDSAGVSDEEAGNPIDRRAARVLRDAGYAVPDPWYGGHQDFLDTLEVIERVTPQVLALVR